MEDMHIASTRCAIGKPLIEQETQLQSTLSNRWQHFIDGFSLGYSHGHIFKYMAIAIRLKSLRER